MLFVNGRTGFPMWLQSPCLSHFTLRLLLCSELSTGPGTKPLSTFSRSKSGWRTWSSPRKELGLTGGSLACRWKKVWPVLAGAVGLAGLEPCSRTLSRVGAVGTEASRLCACFIKSHQEHRPGTAAIYLHFFLVKCYWLFYTKGSLSWMGCTDIQFTSTFCQLCSFPPLLLKLYMVLREETIFSLRGEQKELTALKKNFPS